MSRIRKDLLGVWQFSVFKLLSCVSEKYQNESRRQERCGRGVIVSLLAVVEREITNLAVKAYTSFTGSAHPEYSPGERCLKHSCFTTHDVKTSPRGAPLQTVWFLLTYCTSQTCLPQACKHEVWTDLLRKTL